MPYCQIKGRKRCVCGVEWWSVAHEQEFGELPDDDACGGADVEGVFGAVLGYLDAAVGGVDDGLVHAFDFVA